MAKRKASTASKKAPPMKKRKITQGTLANPRTPTLARIRELKNVDVTLVGQTLFPIATSTGVGAPLLLACIEGTAPTQHVGRRIQLASILYKLNLAMEPTTTGCSSVRVLIVYDKQANAAQCTSAQVLTADQISSPQNLQNSRRFIVLFDDYHDGLGTAGPQSLMLTNYKKLNLPVEFNETNGGTVADIITGSITAFFYSSATLAVAAPLNSFYSRIRFQDD